MGFFKLTKLYQKNKQSKTSSKEQTETNVDSVYTEAHASPSPDNKGRKTRIGSTSSLSTNGQSRKSFSFKQYIPSISSKKEQPSPTMSQDSDLSDSEDDDTEIGPPLAPNPPAPNQADHKVIERMRERHRSQVRLAALRRQRDHGPWSQDSMYSTSSLPRTPQYCLEPMSGSTPKLDEPLYDRLPRSGSGYLNRIEHSPEAFQQYQLYCQQQLYQQYYHQQLYQYEQMKLMQQHYMSSLPKSPREAATKSVYSAK